MNIIKNNPYRTVGLLVGASAREQERQVKRLKQFIEAEQDPQDDFSFPTLGNLHRTLENVNDAASRLNLDRDKMNAALFWFYKGNPITDEPAFDAFKEGDLDQALSIWSKLTSTADVTQRNASAFSNLSTLYLSGALNGTNTKEAILELGILLKIKFLESDFIKNFKSLATDETFKTTKKELQLLFLSQVQLEIEKSGGLTSTKFLEILSKQSFTAKEDFLKAFVQKPIEQVESLINECKTIRKTSKDQAIIAGTNLYNSANPLVNLLKGILGPSNLKYTSISDKVSDEVLQCGIQLFNDYKEHNTYDPGEPAMKLFAKAKTLAIGSIARQRCKENTDNLQEWIDDKPEREKQNKIKTDLDGLITIFEEFDDKPETIENAKSLINRCKSNLSNIKSVLGNSDEFYLKVSTRIASQSQSYIVAEINKVQDLVIKKAQQTFSQHEKRAYFEIFKTKLKEAWEATILIGSLDMEYDFKTNGYNSNRESLRGLCSQVGVSITGYSSTSSASSTSNSSSSDEGIPNWLKWVGGIILFIIFIKACN